MTQNRRMALGVAVAIVLLLSSAMLLAHKGVYGWTLFVMVPLVAGATGTWSMRPNRAWRAARLSAMIGVGGCLLFLLLGREGFICVLMALPVVVPLTVIGGLLAYWSIRSPISRHPTLLCVLFPATLLFDSSAKPPVYSVSTRIVVHAAPERVWKYVVAFSDIDTKPDWVLRTGLAYPVRTRIEGTVVGALRNCDLSTGSVKERVILWDESRELRFTVTETPPAMREMGLYGPIHPKHLNGYYISKAGDFKLTPLSGGRTLLIGSSWYQHGLWPAAYWRLWSDMVVHHIHRRVLEHIRQLSESNE